MSTAAEVRAFIDTNIRQKIAASSILPDTVADELDRLVDFILQETDLPTIQNLTDGATINMNVVNGKWARVTIGGNRTFTFSGLASGNSGLIFITQDGTGNRTITWPVGTKLPTGGLALASGAGEETVVSYVYDGANLKLDAVRYGAGAPPDTTAPTVVSAVVDAAAPSNVVVTFSEAVTGVTSTGWSFKKGGSAWTIGSVSGSGTVWTFVMTTPAANGDTLQRSYNSATGNTLDAAGNELATFTDAAVTNNIPAPGDVTPPSLVSAIISNATPNQAQFTYSEPLNVGSVPATSAYSFNLGRTVTGVSILANVVTVTVTPAWANGDVVQATYNNATPNPVEDVQGNDAPSFTNIAVTNNVSGASFTAPNDVILVLAGGQSNMVGRAANDAAEVTIAANTVYEYRPDTGLLKWLSDPTGQPTGTGSYTVATDNSQLPNLGKRLYELTGKQVIIVQTARGNTGIDLWTTKTNAEYVNMKAWWNALTAYCAANSITIAGKYACWLQGENDAGVKETDAYVESLNIVVNNFITDIGVDHVFVSRIGYDPGFTSAANSEKIMRAQNQLNLSKDEMILVSKAASTFTTGNGKMRTDGVHYTVLGLNEIGEDFAEAIDNYRDNNRKVDMSAEPITALQDPVDYFDDIYNFRSLKTGSNGSLQELFARNNLTQASGTGITFIGKNGLNVVGSNPCNPATIRDLASTHDWSIDITFRFINGAFSAMMLNGRATVWTEDWFWINGVSSLNIKANNTTIANLVSLASTDFGTLTNLVVTYTSATNELKVYTNGGLRSTTNPAAFTALRISSIFRSYQASPTQELPNFNVERIRIVKKALLPYEFDRSPNITTPPAVDWRWNFNSSIAEAQGDVGTTFHVFAGGAGTPAYDADGIVFPEGDFMKLATKLSSNRVTIETRVKFDAAPGNTWESLTGALTNGAGGKPNSGGIPGKISKDVNTIYFGTETANVSWTVTGVTWTDFNVLKFVYNGTTVQLFVNGTAYLAQSISGVFGLQCIGAGHPTQNYSFKGTMDYFYIKNDDSGTFA